MTDPLVIAVTSCDGCLFARYTGERDRCEADSEHRAVVLNDQRPAWCPLDVRPVLVRIAAPRPDVDDSAAGVRFSLLELE